MKFSIVIPARVFTPSLKNTLEKVRELTFSDFETIVILDFEDHLIRENFPQVNFIISGVTSPGVKRNIGIAESQGEYIAFLDDDAYPERDWLLNASRIFIENPQFIALCGPSITPKEADFLEKVSGSIYESFLTSGPTNFRHKISKARLIDDYPSVNLIVKKECLREIGGFDDRFWPGEDTKLCRDLVLKYHQKIFYSPELVVHHFRRSVFHPHLLQVSRYAFHRGLFIKLFPENSLKLSYFIPSFFVINTFFTLVYLFLGLDFLFPSLVFSLIYLGFLFYEGVRTFSNSGSFGFVILTVIGIFVSNLTYGFNFMIGLFSKPKLFLREVDVVNGKYLKG